MPAVNSQVTCPNCRQPVTAQVERVFDLNVDPEAKQRLLSGQSNFLVCPHCGFQGSLASPIVYHDPEKELLLTFFPPELNVNRDEQERIIGSLITKIVNQLAQEKRKAYLFTPKPMFTFKGLIEKVLEADGVTKEMIEAQQKKMKLIGRLMSASPEEQKTIAEQENDTIDSEFFTILNQLMEMALSTQNESDAKKINGLQKVLLENTTFGKQLQSQTEELQAAMKSLQDEGDQLTREKLLDLVIAAPNETRLSALVNLARSGMDYQFFAMLTQRIESSKGDQQETLTALREKILALTAEVDLKRQEHADQVSNLLNQILDSEDIPQAALKALPAVDETFIYLLNQELQNAKNANDTTRMEKLAQLAETLQKAATPPPEIELIQTLLEAGTPEARLEMLKQKSAELTPEFMNTLTAIMQQVSQGDDPKLAKQFEEMFNQVLQFNIGKNLQK